MIILIMYVHQVCIDFFGIHYKPKSPTHGIIPMVVYEGKPMFLYNFSTNSQALYIDMEMNINYLVHS